MKLLSVLSVIVRHRHLVQLLTSREIAETYARLSLGMFWIVLLPVLYVATLVFVRLFLFGGAGQWGVNAGDESSMATAAFAMAIGLVVFWQVQPVLARAPSSVSREKVLVLGSDFPVEVLPWVEVSVALVHTLVRCAILLPLIAVAFDTGLPWTTVLFPLVLIPLLLFSLFIGYLFTALGVFFRDLSMIVNVLMTAIFLVSAIFYPASAIPEPYQTLILLNPIALTVEAARSVLLWGEAPNWIALGILAATSVFLTSITFALFRKLQPRFADAL